MDLADFFTPEEVLRELFDQLRYIPIPVPVKDIALALDIDCIAEQNIKGFEGSLVTSADKHSGMIVVNKNSSCRRKRFTIGHELAHFLLPKHDTPPTGAWQCSAADMSKFASPSSGDRAAQNEIEANRFSAGLLMPDARFRQEIERLGKPSVDHIPALSRKFETSKEATARKYAELHSEPVAVVFSQAGIVRYGRTSSTFPSLRVAEQAALPGQSASEASRANGHAHSKWEEEDPELWLRSSAGVKSLMRQTLNQRDGYQITLLHAAIL